MAITLTDNMKTIWKALFTDIQNKYGVAALMGNMYAESGLKATNLQNSYEKSLGYTDDTYTAAVDNGTYTKFANDSAGYGLCQWTYSTRKKKLLAYAQNLGVSIGNTEMQVGFCLSELASSYKTVYKNLKNATEIKAASDSVLTGYEKPANQSDSVKTTRANYGTQIYNLCKDLAVTSASETAAASDSLCISQAILETMRDDVIKGVYGNGTARKTALGDLYEVVQDMVNAKLYGTTSNYITILAKMVISGKFGNGETRKTRLGDLYTKVQAKVNELLK